jgi:hypothetical protein
MTSQVLDQYKLTQKVKAFNMPLFCCCLEENINVNK